MWILFAPKELTIAISWMVSNSHDKSAIWKLKTESEEYYAKLNLRVLDPQQLRHIFNGCPHQNSALVYPGSVQVTIFLLFFAVKMIPTREKRVSFFWGISLCNTCGQFHPSNIVL
ncbi:hypothetical protein RJT34_17993 [Clitoria ternatea]|uniref:Uncharacterized protein n=1 Tax=Clitoria ternatea TaxID=43366 RepID=A0AAN9J9Z1_CLITE